MADRLRFGGIYFLYLAMIGLLVTYAPWHFAALGFTAAQIGWLFSGRTLVAVVTQPLLMRLADQTGRPIRILKAVMVGGFLVACTLPSWETFALLALVIWGNAIFESGIVPMMDATIVRRFGKLQYGSFRMWGSLGYGLSVFAFGWAVSGVGTDLAGFVALPTLLVLYAATVVLTLSLRPDPQPPRGADVPALEPLHAGRPLATFLTSQALHWAGIMAFNVFFTLHASAMGATSWQIGLAVFLAVGVEAIALQLAGRVFLRVREEHVLALVYVTGVLRWLGTAWAISPWLLVALQVLHFASFGLWFAASIGMLGRFGPASRRGTLQGWFSAAVFAMGGLLGSAGGGMVAQVWSLPAIFIGAAACEIVALLVWWRYRRLWQERPSFHTVSSPTVGVAPSR